MPRHVHGRPYFEPRIIHALDCCCSQTMDGVRCAAFCIFGNNLKRLNQYCLTWTLLNHTPLFRVTAALFYTEFEETCRIRIRFRKKQLQRIDRTFWPNSGTTYIRFSFRPPAVVFHPANLFSFVGKCCVFMTIFISFKDKRIWLLLLMESKAS